MIRFVLAEDQALVRGALAALLTLENDLALVGEAGDGEQAWRLVRELQPDLLVTDIEMPGLTGLELAQRVQRHDEEASRQPDQQQVGTQAQVALHGEEGAPVQAGDQRRLRPRQVEVGAEQRQAQGAQRHQADLHRAP